MAGQLDYCMSHSNKYTAVLIGFNPIQQARYNYIIINDNCGS